MYVCVCRTQLRWFWDGEDEDRFGGTGSERELLQLLQQQRCLVRLLPTTVTGDGKFDNAFIRFGECEEADGVLGTLTGSFA